MARARTGTAARQPTAPAGARRVAGKKGEHVEILANDPLPDIDDPATHLKPVMEQTNEVVADATTPIDEEEATALAEREEAAPERKYAVVVKGGKFLDKQGFRTQVHEGKEVDNLNYDFVALQRAGIRLRVLKPEERGQFIEGM